MVEVALPTFTPRWYQLQSWNAWYHQHKLRELLVWHRRSGKDEQALNKAAVAAHRRVGNYWHMLPEYSQARKAIWNAVNPRTGKKRVDEAFPFALRKRTNDQEMFIEFKNGSTWQIVGSDSYDSLVGVSVIGITFSEWALANPAAWAYMAPILAENGGWASFITTPRGRNHVYDMYKAFRNDPEWHVERLTVDHTGFDRHAVERQLREYTAIFGKDQAEVLIQQEYYCSFEAAILGSYFGREMVEADEQGRIHESLEPIPGVPVSTVMDIGVSTDGMTAMWWFQELPHKIRWLDYYEAADYGVDHFRDEKMRRAGRYNYTDGFDYVPHDAKQRSWTSTHSSGTAVDPKTGQRVDRAGTAKQRIEVMRDLKMRPRLVPDHSLADGINATRRLIGISEWDGTRCKQGIECLRSYQRDWDDKNRVFMRTPKKNWATHGADGFRYGCMAWSGRMLHIEEPVVPQTQVFAIGGFENPAPSPMVSVVKTNLGFNALRDRQAQRRKEKERG